MRKVIIHIILILPFLFYYLKKLILSNVYIAYDLVTPALHTAPGFIEIPLSIHTNYGLLIYSNLISMTPGSLSIEINEEKTKILVHVLYNKNEKKLYNELIVLQERIKKITE